MQYKPTDLISRHFTFHEALYLPSWGRMAEAPDGLTDQTLATLAHFLNTHMDVVREFFGRPINVHCCYRPPAYNTLVKGAAHSSHKAEVPNFAAIDFDVVGLTCDQARAMLEPKLAEWGLRMEDNGPGAPWVHLDNAPVPPGGHRYFKV